MRKAGHFEKVSLTIESDVLHRVESGKVSAYTTEALRRHLERDGIDELTGSGREDYPQRSTGGLLQSRTQAFGGLDRRVQLRRFPAAPGPRRGGGCRRCDGRGHPHLLLVPRSPESAPRRTPKLRLTAAAARPRAEIERPGVYLSLTAAVSSAAPGTGPPHRTPAAMPRAFSTRRRRGQWPSMR